MAKSLVCKKCGAVYQLHGMVHCNEKQPGWRCANCRRAGRR